MIQAMTQMVSVIAVHASVLLLVLLVMWTVPLKQRTKMYFEATCP